MNPPLDYCQFQLTEKNKTKKLISDKLVWRAAPSFAESCGAALQISRRGKKTERENLTKTRDSIDKVVCCRVANKYGYITTQINQRGTSRWARYGGCGWYNNRSRIVIDNIQFNGSICPEPCNDELPLIQRHLHG